MIYKQIRHAKQILKEKYQMEPYELRPITHEKLNDSTEIVISLYKDNKSKIVKLITIIATNEGANILGHIETTNYK